MWEGYSIKLLERDLRILDGISNVKMLTVDQIKRLYFKNKPYAYQRMSQLEGAGYVINRPHVDRKNGRKIGTCYYLTEKGFSEIGIDHYNPRKLIEPRKHDYRVLSGEIYIQAVSHSWEYESSIETKRNRSLNRNCRINCLLRRSKPNKHGEFDEYGVYLLGENPKEETINLLEYELLKNMDQIKKVIVLHQGEGTDLLYKNSVGEIINWENVINERTKSMSVYVMPYERGLEMISYMSEPNYLEEYPFVNIITSITGGGHYIVNNDSPYSDCMYNMRGRLACHVVDMLSNELGKKHYISSYTEVASERSETKMIIFIPKGDEKKWRLRYPIETHPHIKFFPVNMPISIDKANDESPDKLLG